MLWLKQFSGVKKITKIDGKDIQVHNELFTYQEICCLYDIVSKVNLSTFAKNQEKEELLPPDSLIKGTLGEEGKGCSSPPLYIEIEREGDIIHTCMDVFIYVCMYVCMYVNMCMCMYVGVCMYVCMYVGTNTQCIYVYI